jgi:hypothetical protein
MDSQGLNAKTTKKPSVERIRGHRWVATGYGCFQYESDRYQFHGIVEPFGDGWKWHAFVGRSGYQDDRREAMNQVVRTVRVRKATIQAKAAINAKQ